MTDNPMMTQYSETETIPKWDPRIARRAALDALHAEAWMTYQACRAENADDFRRNNILLEIQELLEACKRIDADMDLGLLEMDVEDGEGSWLGRMRRECKEMTAAHYGELPPPEGSRINVLRAHIRQTELMFCYEDATPDDRWIQKILNALSAAAYVAMWAGKEKMTNEEAIALCRDIGWYVKEVVDYPDKPTGIYKFRLMQGFASDYSAYIDTNQEPFATAVMRITRDYIEEDIMWRAGESFKDADPIVLTIADRVRVAMDRTLEAFRKREESLCPKN